MVRKAKKVAARAVAAAVLATKTLFLMPRGSCRFSPTCSEFAATAIERHTLFIAIPLILWRLARCNPFSGGGFDPVPEKTEIRKGGCRE